MIKFSLPVKVGILMSLAVALVSAAGYLTYRSLSSIVSSIQVKSRPDLRLLTIRDISTDLDKAESSVRMYRHTRNQRDIKPYYSVIGGIDEKIDSLRADSKSDTTLLAQIDTISSLIEENMLVWNELIDLYHTDSLEIYIRTLTAKIAVGTLNKKSERSILKRVFSRKAIKEEEQALKEEEQQELISDLTHIGQQDSIKNALMLASESKLAVTGNEIRERLYMLISRMEKEVVDSISAKSKAADELAAKTYQWLALFALMATLLIISVILVVIRYVKKTAEYQVALEKSREETEKMAKTRELFVANMSHEIRTPVNAIYGFTEQLAHEPLNDSSRKMLGVIRSTSEHLVQIVNDILDYSRLQNSVIVLEKTHFVPEYLMENITALFAKSVSDHNSKLHFTISDKVPEVLFGDEHRLRQILFNVIGNAVKFTSNGEISIRIDASAIQGEQFKLILEVKDTGIGISEDMQDKVFEDFTQAEAGTSRKYGGTGLGLSIVKKLVDLHHGEIRLQSSPGEGTTITCELPYHKGDHKFITVTGNKLKIPESLKHLRILIVDDEEYNRMLFRTILNRWKIPFDEAEDGSSSIEKIKSGNFGMLFLDGRMPGLSGTEAASIIRNKLHINASMLPIIGTSATHTDEDMKLYRAAGMNAFLPKPFTEKMLLDVILSVLSPENKDHLSPGADIKAGGPVPAQIDKEPDLYAVNLTNLYHLANNDVTFVKQLVHSFIETTEKGLNGLEEAILLKDTHTIHEIAHRISSPCRHIGADSLYSRLKSIEEQSLNPENIGKLAVLSSESNREFLVIKKGLQHHLEKI